MKRISRAYETPVADFREMVVDNFAGGGGASTGIAMALGRDVDIAINHDAEAVALHRANHPNTHHYCEDVFVVNPCEATAGKSVGLAWFSPDCKHFSKARGSKPKSKKIRGLAWVMVKWAATVAPRVMILENVEEFQTWGPPDKPGITFRNFGAQLRNLGYVCEWRELRACDYGAPTIRKRLFLIARRDGRPIVWPTPTHAAPESHEVKSGKLKPWRTAAECIDFSIPCPSIFLTKAEARAIRVKRPLADATMRRIFKGYLRYVVNAANPFFVNLTHQGGNRIEPIEEPFRTITGAHRGEKALCFPFMTEHANGSSQRTFAEDEPMRTQCAEIKGGHFAHVQAFLTRQFGNSIGSEVEKPAGTVTAGGGGKTALVTSYLTKLKGTCKDGQRIDAPIHTVQAGGLHYAEVRAFLTKYYGEGGQDQALEYPMHTITAKARMGLVTVEGEDYQVSDFGIRMLRPRELYRAQGFPDSYIIDVQINGRKLTQEAQIRMCGNSVCPPMAEALVAANVPELCTRKLEVVA